MDMCSVPSMKKRRTEAEIMKSWADVEGEPVVSICCITFNHQDFIQDALDSFLMQETDFPFEILIHDDASTDKTASILQDYQERYPSIITVVFQQINLYSKGVRQMNQRFLFPISSGRYIALCDGDDYWVDSKKLQIQKDFLDYNPDYVICYGDSKAFDETGILDLDFGGATRDLSRKELCNIAAIFTLTTMFRKKVSTVIPKEGALSIYGDQFLWSMLSEYGKGKYLPEILPSMYRSHEGGIHSMKEESALEKEELNLRLALFVYYWNRSQRTTAIIFLLKVFKRYLKTILK